MSSAGLFHCALAANTAIPIAKQPINLFIALYDSRSEGRRANDMYKPDCRIMATVRLLCVSDHKKYGMNISVHAGRPVTQLVSAGKTTAGNLSSGSLQLL
jgi:hypothetical protein